MSNLNPLLLPHQIYTINTRCIFSGQLLFEKKIFKRYFSIYFCVKIWPPSWPHPSPVMIWTNINLHCPIMHKKRAFLACFISYQQLFNNYSSTPVKKAWPSILTNLNSLYLIMCCIQFNWNQPSDMEKKS